MYSIPEYKKINVLIDTDAACEADDPFSIVHALLSPKLRVRGILAEHFSAPGSVRKSYDEIRTILDAMGLDVPVLMGQDGPLARDASVSEAADFIIEKALEQKKLEPGAGKLYLLCQGAITNVAMAFRKNPDIVDSVIVVWIGTHGTKVRPAPFREFNAGNDVPAANAVLSSGAELWLIPSDVYRTVRVGLSELECKVAPCGQIGLHLFENMVNYNLSENAGWTQGESWSLGDSPAIAAAINPDCGHYRYEKAPFINEDTSSAEEAGNPVIRVYRDVDTRYILEDFFAKLQLFARQKG